MKFRRKHIFFVQIRAAAEYSARSQAVLDDQSVFEALIPQFSTEAQYSWNTFPHSVHLIFGLRNHRLILMTGPWQSGQTPVPPS